MKIDLNLKKYYMIGLIPYIFIVIIFQLVDLTFVNQIYFYLAYFWNFYLLSPIILSTISNKRYRFAFVKIIILMDNKIQTINSKNIPYLDSVLRSLSPLLFVFVIYAIGSDGNLFFSILGSFTFEIIFISFKKFTLKKKY